MQNKTKLYKYSKLALQGFLSGVLVAIAAFTFLVLTAYAQGSGIQTLTTYFIAGVGFCVGIILIIALDAALFTGRIGYVFERKPDYLIELLIVFLTNFLGTVIFTILFYYTVFPAKLVPGSTKTYADLIQTMIAKKLDFKETPLWRTFLGAIGTGILLHSAIYSFNNAKNKAIGLLSLLFAVWTFLLLGFDHCIASFSLFSFGFQYNYAKVALFIFIVIIGNSTGSIFIQSLLTLIKKFKEKEAEAELK